MTAPQPPADLYERCRPTHAELAQRYNLVLSRAGEQMLDETVRQTISIAYAAGYAAGLAACICENCNGTGDLGHAKDGRLIACEDCGGHEDALGSGRVHLRCGSGVKP